MVKIFKTRNYSDCQRALRARSSVENVLHLQTCKEKTAHEPNPETQTASLIKAYSGLTNAKWKTVLCSDESKHEISFGNDGHCVLCAEEEGETV